MLVGFFFNWRVFPLGQKVKKVLSFNHKNLKQSKNGIFHDERKSSM